VTHSAIASCATFLFLLHFDVICDLLKDRCTATWNLFVNFRVCQNGEGPTFARLTWNKAGFMRTKFISLLYKTNRFHVAVHLSSNRSQRTSKCGKNISDNSAIASCATFFFLPHFDVICDLLQDRCMATWNLFVKQTFNEQLLKFNSFTQKINRNSSCNYNREF